MLPLANSGANLVVITYDLKATTSVAPAQTYTNTASLTNYASQKAGPDFLSSPTSLHRA